MKLIPSKFGKSVRNALIASVAAISIASCNISIGGGGIGGTASPKVDLGQPVKVALLVPTQAGGEIGNLGRSLERAAKMALSQYNAGDIDLIVKATNFQDANVLAMANQAKAEGAQVILGPLSGFNAAAVAAAHPDTPVFTFSNNADIVSGNTYVLGTTFEVTADRVIKHVRATGARSMGIVATADVSGEAGIASSVKAAQSNGMSVVYTGKYPLSVQGIQASAPGIAAAMKSSGAQALMLTDTPSGGLGLIVNAMAEQGYTSNDAAFMGISRWDQPAAFLQQAQLNGGYFAVPDPNAIASFNSRYQSATGSAPTPVAGLGYDGVSAIIHLVKSAKSRGDTTPFDDRDIRRASFPGASGTFKITSNHQTMRPLAVMQVQGNRAVMVSPAR